MATGVIEVPVTQTNQYDNRNNCLVCGTHIANPCPPDCVFGDGIDHLTPDQARDIMTWRIRRAGAYLADGFLNEFATNTAQRDVIIDGVLHAREGQRVLARAIYDNQRSRQVVTHYLLVSMATADIIQVPARVFEAYTRDCNGRLIERGTYVERTTDGERGVVTGVSHLTKKASVKGRLMFGSIGEGLRVVEAITLNWTTTVVEQHSRPFDLHEVAKTIGIDTTDQPAEQIRDEVERLLGLIGGCDTGYDGLAKIDELLSGREGTRYADHCHPSTESRVFNGHGEG